MSVYTEFLAAAIEAGSTGAVLRDCKAAFVLEEEQALHRFVMSHLNRYGQLPSFETLERGGNFAPLPEVEEPVNFYFDRLRQRYLYNVINERHPQLREALQARNTEEAMGVLREMVEMGSMVGDNNGATSLAAEASLVIAQMQERKWISGLIGVPSGWHSLDEATLGFMGGDIIVIAGRPSMGKSWLLIESAFAAWMAGRSVLFVSMEMSKAQIAQRWMGRHMGVNPNYIRRGQVNSWLERDLYAYADNISAMPRVTMMSGDMQKQVDGIEAAILENMPDVIYVDAAYLLTPSGVQNRGISKWEAIGKVIGQLKQISIRVDRPIVITVQFNRNVKNSSTRELDLGDIGGSDSIPQDASIVLGARIGLPPFEGSRRRVQIMKNREGAIGEFHTNFKFAPPSMTEINPEVVDRTDVTWMS